MTERLGPSRAATEQVGIIRLAVLGELSRRVLREAGPDAAAAVAALRRKDPPSHAHTERVAAIVTLMATADHAPSLLVTHMGAAAWLHDIGKLDAPDGSLDYTKFSRQQVIETVHAHVEGSVRRVRGMRIPGLSTSYLIATIGGHHEHPSPLLSIEPYPDPSGANPYAMSRVDTEASPIRFLYGPYGELILSAADQIDAASDPLRHPHAMLPDAHGMEDSIMDELILNPDFAPLSRDTLRLGTRAAIGLNAGGLPRMAPGEGQTIILFSAPPSPVA